MDAPAAGSFANQRIQIDLDLTLGLEVELMEVAKAEFSGN